MSLPSITVAIPTYNRRGRVVELATEIAAQLQPGDELVVSDDGSTDGTADALAAHAGVTVVRQPNNLGMVGNWNFCLTAGTNAWVTLVHDDDRLLPGGLDAIRRACALAGGPALIAHAEGRGLRQLVDGGYCYQSREAGAIAALDAEFCPSGVTTHRAIPAAVGTFGHDFPYSADMEYFARVSAAFPSLMILNPRVLEYVVDGNNYQLKTWRERDFLACLREVEAAAIAHAKLPHAEAERLLAERLRRDMMHMIRTAAKVGDTAVVRQTARALLALPRASRQQKAGLWLAAQFGRSPGRLLA